MDKMSKVFPKLSKASLLLQKKEELILKWILNLGGNSNAKSENMPKDNIDSAIKRANDKDKRL